MFVDLCLTVLDEFKRFRVEERSYGMNWMSPSQASYAGRGCVVFCLEFALAKCSLSNLPIQPDSTTKDKANMQESCEIPRQLERGTKHPL